MYYTKLGIESAEAAADVTRVLDKAAGFLRTEVAKGSSLRTVPKLTFKFDESVGRGRHMEDLLGRARASDALHGNEAEADDS